MAGRPTTLRRFRAPGIQVGRFREDPFYRLAVAVVEIPPLRSRAGEIGLLVKNSLDRINQESVAETRPAEDTER